MKIFLPFLCEFGKIVRFAVYIVIRVGKSSATSAQRQRNLCCETDIQCRDNQQSIIN